jgi:hypothetical protein
MSRAVLLAPFLFAATITSAGAQDYIFRPGPRGFDPRMNRYGATEAPPTAVTRDARFNPEKTSVSIEILMPDAGSTLDAQQWSKTFAGFGYSARFRKPLFKETPKIDETSRGPLRFVTVIGVMDSRGRLVFNDRQFTPGDGAELKEWLEELKTYGAQGSPDGQPMWGLSRSQFESVYAALAHPVSADVQGLPFVDAISKLGVAKDYPFHFSVAAKQAMDAPGQPQGVSRSVAGITAGTALAFVLNEYGMGFHPERRPDGSVELLIEPLPAAQPVADADSPPVVWPIGWEIDEPATSSDRRSKPVKDDDAVPSNRQIIAAPLLQQREAIGMSSPSVYAALDSIETETGVPILLDRPAAASTGVDLAKARVAVPPTNTNWNIVLRRVVFPNRLRHEIRRDEVGNPIVFVTSIRRGR